MFKLFDFFKKKNDKSSHLNSAGENFVDVLSPLDGEIIDLTQIPDEAFASGLVGDGVGIIPKENSNTLFSPCTTDIMNIYDTGHAVTFDYNQLELLIHIGVGTVKLKGKGFDKLLPDGSVKANDEIIRYDLDYIRNNSKSEKTAVVIANMEKVTKIEKKSGKIKSGELLMRIYLANL